MRSVQYLGSGAAWTAALALPAAMFGLCLAALIDRYSVEIASAVARAFDANWRAFVALRWPEAAGILIGQLLLMAVLLLAGGRALGSRAETS
jgi:hypothetical protein